MILVTGARGTVGRKLTALLQARGQPFRALARNPEKAKSATLPGGVWRQGDFVAPDTLRAAFDGIECMFLLCGAQPDMDALKFPIDVDPAVLRDLDADGIEVTHGLGF